LRSLWNYCHRWWQRRWSTVQLWLVPAAAALVVEAPPSPAQGENLRDAFDACSVPPASPTASPVASPVATDGKAGSPGNAGAPSVASLTASPVAVRTRAESSPGVGAAAAGVQGVRLAPPTKETRPGLKRHSVDGTPRRRLQQSKSLPPSNAP
jgi:hypothetical protein